MLTGITRYSHRSGHAIHAGMNEGIPEWIDSYHEAPTMTQMAEQSAMMDNDSDASSYRILVEAKRMLDSDDETVIHDTPHGITSGTPVTPEHNYVATQRFPFDDRQ